MTTLAPAGEQTRLVVLATDTDQIARWLSEPARRATELVVPGHDGPMLGFPSDIVGVHDAGGSGWDYVRIPLDGPVEALAIALRALRTGAGTTQTGPASSSSTRRTLPCSAKSPEQA